MSFSPRDAERLRNYEIVLEEVTVIVDEALKGAKDSIDYLRKFADLLEEFDQSPNAEKQLIGLAMLTVIYSTFVKFFLYNNHDLPSTRNVMCNLLTIILDIAAKQHSRMDGNVIEEMEVLLASFHHEEAKNYDCLEKADVETIITHWNQLQHPANFLRFYAEKWDRIGSTGIAWSEVYGFFIAIYLYLANTQPKDNQIFVDRNAEYVVFAILIRLSQNHFTMHNYFLDMIREKLNAIKPFAF